MAKRLLFAAGGFAFGVMLMPFIPFMCAWLWLCDIDYDSDGLPPENGKEEKRCLKK